MIRSEPGHLETWTRKHPYSGMRRKSYLQRPPSTASLCSPDRAGPCDGNEKPRLMGSPGGACLGKEACRSWAATLWDNNTMSNDRDVTWTPHRPGIFRIYRWASPGRVGAFYERGRQLGGLKQTSNITSLNSERPRGLRQDNSWSPASLVGIARAQSVSGNGMYGQANWLSLAGLVNSSTGAASTSATSCRSSSIVNVERASATRASNLFRSPNIAYPVG
jgi:hypothetical protein